MVVTADKEENIGQILSDIEILNLFECELNDPSKSLRYEYSAYYL